ncbi:MAG: Gfo/Idh/MocA family oxidoreductase [Verrucomicrobia bacterium]|nr:Gfo/Idh/MocA family oxidoreductase [Verrucomicrobiota bacterium]
MKVTPSTRRQFLKTSAAAVTAFTILPRHVLGGPRFVAPSERVNIAIVGAGGRGTQNLKALLALADAQIVAVADPAETFSLENYYYKGVGGRLPALKIVDDHHGKTTPGYKAAGYEDFRVMLEKEKGLDAVFCGTPDHLHAYVSILAMRAGKHVYCEKPLTHNIWEAREVARVAKETGLATQMGNQGHSQVGIRECVEHIRAGTIGAVKQIYSWVGTKRWNPALTTKPAAGQSVPSGMNWDLWIGPREPRAFHAAYHPVSWRDFWAFGTTSMGDFACHDMDAATWAFDLPAPTRIESYAVGPTDAEIAPHGCIIHFDFPARGQWPAQRLTWMDGGLRPAAPEALGKFALPNRGTMFMGEKGVIQCDGAGAPPRIFPESLRASVQKPAATIPRSKGHHRDWLDAIKGGPAASSNFAYGARLTEIGLLGVLALRLGKPFEWDAAGMKVVGKPDAEPLIRGTYREGWKIG